MGTIKATLTSCFIIAPLSADISPLRRLLSDRGVRFSHAADIRPSGSSILDLAERTIRESDFVCAVIQHDHQSANVLFELGLARGLGRPLFIIVDDLTDLPVDVRDLSVVRAKLSEFDAIAFHLDAFLRHAPKSLRGARHSPQSNRLGPVHWSDDTLAQLANLAPSQRAFQTEQIVARLFEQAGAVVSRNDKPESDLGLDMVVWLDALQPAMANPLMVEVKSGQLNEHGLRQAEAQVRKYFEKVPAGAGMIVYHDLTGRNFAAPPSGFPQVMRFALSELAGLVQSGELPAEIMKRRNRLVHGESP